MCVCVCVCVCVCEIKMSYKAEHPTVSYYLHPELVGLSVNHHLGGGGSLEKPPGTILYPFCKVTAAGSNLGL